MTSRQRYTARKWLPLLVFVYLFEACTAENFARIARNSCTSSNCTYNAGRLDISRDSGFSWYSVCDDGFENVDAAVACKTMGYTGGTVLAASLVINGPFRFGADDVACTGTETTIFSCPYNSNHNCWLPDKEVGVRCTGSTASPPSLNNDETVVLSGSACSEFDSCQTACAQGYRATVLINGLYMFTSTATNLPSDCTCYGLQGTVNGNGVVYGDYLQDYDTIEGGFFTFKESSNGVYSVSIPAIPCQITYRRPSSSGASSYSALFLSALALVASSVWML